MDPIEEAIKANTRPYKECNFKDIPIEHVQYAAGLSDTDGCFQVSTGNVAKFYINQAERGIDALHFMYDTFGGVIYLHKKGNEKHQTSYDWCLHAKDAIDYSKLVMDYLLIKKREAEVLATFPLVNKHQVYLVCTNKTTGDIIEFDTLTDCQKHFNKKPIKFTNDQSVIGNWTIKKKYTSEQMEQFMQVKSDIDKQLRMFHNTAHDEIPVDIVPSHAWIAGIMDGEGTFDTNGKSGQHHGITQKWRPLLDLFKRLYGGSVWYRKGSDTFGWEVYTEAKRLVQEISPYIRGKKKQVDLLLNMKPGEAPEIHVKLRELKGNCTATTPRVDALKDGAHGIKATVTKPHTAPRKLPTGVFKFGLGDNRIKAQIQYKKKIYILGVFDADKSDDAHQLYLQYKNAISLEKRGGPKVDFGDTKHWERKAAAAAKEE